jgi:hypothetical protein
VNHHLLLEPRHLGGAIFELALQSKVARPHLVMLATRHAKTDLILSNGLLQLTELLVETLLVLL